MNRRLLNTIRRGGVYHFKKRIPKALRAADVFGGAEFVQYSLRTRDADHAAGMMRDALNEFDRRKQEAETELGIPIWESRTQQRRVPEALVRRPSIRQIELAADEFYRNYIRENSLIEDGVRSRGSARGLELLVAGRRIDDWENRKLQLGKPGEENVHSFDATVSIYDSHGWMPDPDTKEFGILLDLVRKAEKTAIDYILNQANSDTFLPSDERDALFKSNAQASYTLANAIEDYSSRFPQNVDINKKMRLSYQAWMDLIGNDRLDEISRKQVVDFKELLEMLPSRAMLRFPNSTFSEAIEKNSELPEPFETISPKTIKLNYISVLGTAVELSIERGRLDRNPFNGVKVEGSRESPDHRRSFSLSELNRIFMHPSFTGCLSTNRRYSAGALRIFDHLYWAPLVGLFTGMRASEIGAIKVSDLSSLNLQGSQYWFLSVGDAKTPAGCRDVPIHPHLIELGFVDFWQNQSKTSGRLFESWKKPKGKKLSEARVIRNFNEKICADIGTPGNRPTFHCFRHTMQSAMIKAELPDPIQKAILGHAQEGMKSNYFKPRIENYAEIFCERVEFRDLDLSHLKPDN